MSTWEVELERTLFEAALAFPDAAARARFLDETCANKAELRARLSRLLQEHDRAEQFFDFEPLRGDGEAPALRPSAPASGETAPSQRYKLVRPLGEGGSGLVYLAEQIYPVKRPVALKILRHEMGLGKAVDRLNIECAALARMTHPNIARIYDTGSTEDGRPFFTMEMVVGERITTYCESAGAGLQDRIALMLQVCDAVQHAHQKGIIHRDLKPSNVLIELRDGRPFPKIIDFGIAKILAAAADEEETGEDAGAFAGTPAYMSPEQANGEDGEIDTRTDVYGLGALLYELLLGRPPVDAGRFNADEVEELRARLSQSTPPLPSAWLDTLSPVARREIAARLRLSDGAMLRTLREDLDWILSKALARDRSERYATVHEFAMDLQRYLGHQAVSARPASEWYRMKKYFRRHRTKWLVAGAVFLISGAGLGTSAWFYAREQESQRLQRELRDEAQDAARITKAVYLAREGGLAEANAVLAEIKHIPDRPSYEGVTVYRQIGDWLARQKRWAETSERFAVVQRFGALDGWGQVTRDHQSYGVALIGAEDFAGYDRFRLEHARRLTQESNGDAVGRVLKICLLRPADPAMSEKLLPHGRLVEAWFSSLAPEHARTWATVPVSLWRLRQGDYLGAARAAQGGFDEADHRSACGATQRLLLALCALNTGNDTEASRQLRIARDDIERVFAGDLPAGDSLTGFWYDWLFARILLDEALAAHPRFSSS